MPRADGLLSTKDAALLVNVTEGAIRRWRSLGYLGTQGLDERSYPLHTAAAVRHAEQIARESGLKSASGADPRRRRGATKLPAMPLSVADGETAEMCRETRHSCPACPTSARELGAAAAAAHTAIMAAVRGDGGFEQAFTRLAALRTALDTWERDAAAHEAAMRAWEKTPRKEPV